MWLMLWKPVRKVINVVLIPNIPFNRLRILLYRLVGFKIGKHVFIGMKCYMDDVKPANTIIEDNVTISYGCYFAVHGKYQGTAPITVKQEAYIGVGAIILSSQKIGPVVIGEGAIVGAGAVVNRSIPDHATAVGVPARIIKYADKDRALHRP